MRLIFPVAPCHFLHQPGQAAGTGLRLYINENDDYFPFFNEWQQIISCVMSSQEEMKKLCYCPCGMGKQHSSDPMAFSIHFLDYGYNYTTLGDAMFNGSAWVPAPMRLTKIINPSGMVVLADSTDDYVNQPPGMASSTSTSPTTAPTTTRLATATAGASTCFSRISACAATSTSSSTKASATSSSR